MLLTEDGCGQEARKEEEGGAHGDCWRPSGDLEFKASGFRGPVEKMLLAALMTGGSGLGESRWAVV